MQLSVLSALARQNVDPWEFAQRLASMPRQPAIRVLTPLLARTPTGLAAPGRHGGAPDCAVACATCPCRKRWYFQNRTK